MEYKVGFGPLILEMGSGSGWGCFFVSFLSIWHVKCSWQTRFLFLFLLLFLLVTKGWLGFESFERMAELVGGLKFWILDGPNVSQRLCTAHLWLWANCLGMSMDHWVMSIYPGLMAGLLRDMLGLEKTRPSCLRSIGWQILHTQGIQIFKWFRGLRNNFKFYTMINHKYMC